MTKLIRHQGLFPFQLFASIILIEQCEFTNRRFADFAEAAGHGTESRRP